MDDAPRPERRLPPAELLVLFGALIYLSASFLPWVGAEGAVQANGYALGPLVLAGHAPPAAGLLWQLLGRARLGPGMTAGIAGGYAFLLLLTVLGLAVAWTGPGQTAIGLVLATLGLLIHANGLWRVARRR